MDFITEVNKYSMIRLVLAVLISIGMSYNGLKKGSLSTSGAIAAFFTGFFGFYASYRYGLILILFYLTSSKLTKTGKNTKAKLEADYGIASKRGASQVFGSSIFATIIAILFILNLSNDLDIKFSSEFYLKYQQILFHPISIMNLFLNELNSNVNSKDQYLSSILNCLYISHYACATADTWASEVLYLYTVPYILVFNILYI